MKPQLGVEFERQRKEIRGRVLPHLLVIPCLIALTSRSAFADAVYGWGNNVSGAIGDGTSYFNGTSASYYFVPTPNPLLTGGITAISTASPGCVLAIQNGAVIAWGANGSGQLGVGDMTDRISPVSISALANGVTAIATGGNHSLAVQNGAVYTWGQNSSGELGLGDTLNRVSPVAINSLSSGVSTIAAGDEYSLAVQSGALFAWGFNQSGAMGVGDTVSSSTTPIAVTSMSSGVTAVVVNGFRSMAIKNGGLYTWGDNSGSGALGDGGFINEFLPVAITSLSSGVTSMATGEAHSLAVMNGQVYAWGDDGDGELGLGADLINQDTPVAVPGLTSIIAVAAGQYSSYALSSDGSLWVWGFDGHSASYELGLGNLGNGAHVDSPEQILPPAGYIFTGISANYTNAFATVAPVPEPGTIGLLFFGTGAIFAAAAKVRAGNTGREQNVTNKE